MQQLDTRALEQLVTETRRPAVTMYLPVTLGGAPPHLTENQIRLKNLIGQATEQLQKHGSEHQLTHELETFLTEQASDYSFWEDRTPSLLICAVPGQLQQFDLPIDSEAYVAVDDRYHLAPVIGLTQDAHAYYVLALAQQGPQLYKGTMYGLQAEAIGLPSDLKAALNIDENNQKTENQGTATGPSSNGAAGSANSGRGWFNGRGGARNPQEEDRHRFFRLIDKALSDNADTSLPLILAGVDSDVAEFRQLSKYPNILPGSIEGNHTLSQPHELFKKAYAIIWSELVVPEHQAAVAEFQRLNGAVSNRTAVDSGRIMEAAERGRVDTLLTSMVRRTSDTVQDSMTDVLRLTFPNRDGAAQLNRLAAKVAQTSGRILNLLPEEMPPQRALAASLRY